MVVCFWGGWNLFGCLFSWVCGLVLFWFELGVWGLCFEVLWKGFVVDVFWVLVL